MHPVPIGSHFWVAVVTGRLVPPSHGCYHYLGVGASAGTDTREEASERAGPRFVVKFLAASRRAESQRGVQGRRDHGGGGAVRTLRQLVKRAITRGFGSTRR